MKDDKIPYERIDETRVVLEKSLDVVRSSVSEGTRLTDDQMFTLGRSMMDHLLAVGAEASW